MTLERPGGGDSTRQGAVYELDAGLADITNREIRNLAVSDKFASSVGLRLQELATDSDASPVGVAHHLAALVGHLTENDPGFKPGAALQPQRRSRNRLYAIVNQFIEYPDELAGFLENPAVCENPAVVNPVILRNLAEQHWMADKKAGPVTTAQLLVFAVKNSLKPTEVVDTFSLTLGQSMESEVKPTTPQDRINRVFGFIGLARTESGSGEFDEIFPEVHEAAREAEIMEKKNVAFHRRMNIMRQNQTEATDNEKRQMEQAWIDLGNNLVKDPERTYWRYFARDRYPRGDNIRALLSASSRYLAVTRGEGDPHNTGHAEAVLASRFQVLVEHNATTLITKSPEYSDIRPHLLRVCPDRKTLDGLVEKYPHLREDGEFFAEWKSAFLDREREKQVDELVGNVDMTNLRKQGINRLKIDTSASHGIKYVDQEALFDDLKKFFVYPIDHNREMAGNIDKLPEWSRANLRILSDFVMGGLNAHLNDDENKYNTFTASTWTKGHFAYMAGTRDLKAGQQLEIAVQDSGAEKPILYLKLPNMENFAAFVEKPVEYPAQSIINVELELNPPVLSPGERNDLIQGAHNTNLVGLGMKIQNIGDKAEMLTSERWQFDHDKVPNNAAHVFLRSLVSDAGFFYSIDTNPSIYPVEDEPLPEVRKLGSYNPVTRFTDAVNFKDIAKLVINATPEQAKKLSALKSFLARTKKPLHAMSHR